MGIASGCGCKEVYRFTHTTYPYSSVLFYSSIPTFCSFKKMFFVLYYISYIIIYNYFIMYDMHAVYIRKNYKYNYIKNIIKKQQHIYIYNIIIIIIYDIMFIIYFLN